MLRSDDPMRVPTSLDATSSQRLGEFVRCHRKQLVHGIARHSNLQPQDQDEVLSDTLFVLCKVQHKLDPTRSPFPLAYSIALRKARTKLKHLAALRSRSKPLQAAGDLPDRRPSGESHLAAEEMRASVQSFLGRLKSADRRIIEARHFDDLKWGRIAACVGLPKTSVIRRYHAIIAEARKALARLFC